MRSLWDGDGFDLDIYGETSRRPSKKRQARRERDDFPSARETMRDTFDASMGIIGIGIVSNVGLGMVRSIGGR